ncbi:MAG: PAS domain S-box protein [Pseudomonadales bacterium]|nr:PAS domain S-box protein [Pseudomonadales bacterium]MBO6595787.1 PAS domain S-box protein [Pseudomonadales bacterium]MBO6657406.1 PAS domain S-box protein [Pseudomonadales bacterium]MBO6822271.1 PAS domain S-box protein [Pseudomonadales bacterium]
MTEPLDLSEGSPVFKSLLDNSQDLFTLVDETGLVLYQNKCSLWRLGYKPEEIVGLNISDFLHPDDLALAVTSLGNLKAKEDIDRIVVRLRNSNGEWRKVETLGWAQEFSGQQCVLLNSRDISQQHEAVERLRDSETLLSAAFNSTSTISSITDIATGEFIDVNDAWSATCGWTREDAIGKTSIDLNIWGSNTNRARVVAELQKAGALKQFPATIHNKEGGIRSVILDAEMVQIGDRNLMFLSGVDITERERVEAQLRQAQRLEAVGQLTGGIAHDLNNMLTVVLGQVDLTLDRDVPMEQVNDALEVIRRATERGSDLIQQLMIFSRRQTLRPRTINAGATINDLKNLLERTLGGEISVETEVDADTWDSNLDEALLENALLNLALNSRDAMTQGGKLTISVSNTQLDERTAHRYQVVGEDFVKLRVADTGKGMDRATVANAFEPFFTTKPMGQGTGLGLSMVFGFVKQSGGHIEIESEVRVGTTITIYLPRSDVSPAPEVTAPTTESRLKGKSVLVIEDSEELRNVVKLLLVSLGCEVHECEGMALTPPQGHVDLILSDVVLPGNKQGPDLVVEALEHYPEAKVVYMSGYPRDRFTDVDLTQSSDLLKKPFTRDELQQKLSNALA